MNALALSFEGMPVRSHVDGQGVPWFVAADVCAVLGIVNGRDALASLDDDERDDVGITDAIGRTQAMSTINESGLYSLILRSRKPEARRFKRWVTHDVLSQIRRTGGYGTAPDLLARLERLEAELGRLRPALAAPRIPPESGRPPLILPIANRTIDNLIGRWIVERAGVPVGRASDLRSEFEQWAGRAVTATAFGRSLTRLGAARHKIHNGVAWDLSPLVGA